MLINVTLDLKVENRQITNIEEVKRELLKEYDNLVIELQSI